MMIDEKYDACVVGSGMAGLTTAALLAKDGLKVGVIEQNWLPGGCTSSYWRKGFVFESGATTLVGLSHNMPLQHVLDQTGISISAIALEVPMQVHLKSGKVLTRYQDLNRWIAEAERVFGPKGQRPFWEFCFKISEFVWQTSIRQTAFPPSRLRDLITSAKNVTFNQLRYAPYSLMSTQALLKRFGLLDNAEFVEFVNEQLLITAQNHIEEVNVLFGCTALCYTNYPNYYVPGGLINLVNPFVSYIEANGGQVHLRHEVDEISADAEGYKVTAKYKKEEKRFSCQYLISALPVNNTLRIFPDGPLSKFRKAAMPSEQLNSAFQMGIGFKTDQKPDCIHHQIHLPEPLPETGSASIFISLSHPSDTGRADEAGQMVASVSTHAPNPQHRFIHHAEKAEEAILSVMEERGFLRKSDVVYQHSSTPHSWQKWTKREWGFVGGYPQYMRIKPWQMLDSRLDGKKAYICGDSTYPGQGIPGATLSGIIAYEKLKADHL